MKRPLMGAAAGAHADLVIITADNSRSEDPSAIASEVESGLRDSVVQYEIELDRRRAIERAVGLAEAGDIIVIAGKGHESGQTVSGDTVEFDDRTVVREILQARL